MSSFLAQRGSILVIPKLRSPMKIWIFWRWVSDVILEKMCLFFAISLACEFVVGVFCWILNFVEEVFQ